MTVTTVDSIQPLAIVAPRSVAGGGSRPAAGLKRLGNVILDGVMLLALVWSIPLAILLVGMPIAGAISLVLWLGRIALSLV